MKTEVVAVFIKENDKFLIAQKKDKWEFPGGKIKKSEKKEEALKRELKEELGIEIEVKDFLFKYESEKFIFYFYSAKIIKGEFFLKEHKSIKWVSFDEAKNLNFYEPDEKFLSSMASIK